MTNKPSLSNFELITMLLSKRIENVDIDRAYTLADMAVRDEYPDETFSEEECKIWSDYRYRLRAYK